MATVELFPDFRDFLGSLNSAKVKYLVLGGYAVNHYGYRRVTDDLDVWVSTDAPNAKRLSLALQRFAGFPAHAVEPEQFTQRGKVFMFGRPPGRIDILTGPSGVNFSACHRRRRVVDWDGLRVPLISLADLRQNKLASGRAKDLADLENLPAEQRRRGSITPRAARRRSTPPRKP